MKSLLSWFNDRTGLFDGCAWLADAPVPGCACCCKVWPCVIAFLFCVQAISGFFMWTYYSPSSQTAWESVYYLQNDVQAGWLLRGIHHYSAHVLLAIFILYIVQMILTRTCRAPRELVFWATVGLGLFALAAVLTGDLLGWDQNGYSATKTRTGFLRLLPWVGDSLLKIAIGGPGPELGSLSVTRFFALHVGLFGGGFLGLFVVRFILARRANVALAAEMGRSTPYWPRQAWRVAAACLVVMGIVVAMACQHGTTPPNAGVPQLSPANTDPAAAYSAARPEWFLTGVFEFAQLFPAKLEIVPIFVTTGILLCIVLAMPFLAKYTLGHCFNVAFTLAVLAGLGGLTYYSYAKDRGDEAHQAAIAAEKQQAVRTYELVRRHGIPPTGALTLLRSDPKTQGPKLFAQQCASCHNHTSGSAGDIKAETPTAPNLAKFASREWIAGLLNPKKVGSAEYFGGTAFRSGKMAGFVKETLGEAEPEDIQKVAAALSAEAKLPSQKAMDAKDAEMIKEGHALMADDFNCIKCHRFHGKGPQGTAPELTGYGSSAWIAGIIAKPNDKQYYGSKNDRMPVYAASPDPKQNTLSAEQIRLLTDWLRGDWYEE